MILAKEFDVNDRWNTTTTKHPFSSIIWHILSAFKGVFFHLFYILFWQSKLNTKDNRKKRNHSGNTMENDFHSMLLPYNVYLLMFFHLWMLFFSLCNLFTHLQMDWIDVYNSIIDMVMSFYKHRLRILPFFLEWLKAFVWFYLLWIHQNSLCVDIKWFQHDCRILKYSINFN